MMSLLVFADYIPLCIFFISYKLYNLITATAAMLVSSICVMALTYLHTKKKPSKIAITSAILIAVMGGATLISNNTVFIKMKPTLLYVLLAAVIFIALISKRYVLRTLFGQILQLEGHSWRSFSWQWIIFLCVVASLNEYIWRNYSEELWVNFKVFFVPIAMMTLCIVQLFIYRRYIRPR